MNTNQQQMHPKSNGGKKIKTLYWVLFFTFMLFIFSQTTPFMFNWPKMSQEGNIYAAGASGMIERSAQGNMKRRVWMFILAGVFTLSLLRAKNRFQINSPLGWVVIFYLGWILCSIMVSAEPMYTIRRIAVVYLMWIAAIAAAVQLSFQQLTRMAVFVTGVTLFLAIGNELRFNNMDVFNSAWRFAGLFHTVAMGVNIGIFVISTMFLISVEKRPIYRYLLWGLVAVGVVFLILTRTRTSAIATIFAVVVYWSYIVTPLKKILLLLGAVICLSAAYVGIGNQLLQYGEEASTLGRGESGKETAGSLTGRIPLWQYSMKSLAERPLCGYGYSSFLTPTNVDKFDQNVGWRPNTLHSAYVNEIMGTGIIGGAAFIAMLLLAMIRALSLARRTPQYFYIFSVIVWAATVYITEGGVANGMTFVIFYILACIAKLAFCPVKEGSW